MKADIVQSIGAQIEQKDRRRVSPLCLSWNIHLLLSSGISALGLQAFGLEPGLTQTIGSPGSQASSLGFGYVTDFSSSPACRWQIE